MISCASLEIYTTKCQQWRSYNCILIKLINSNHILDYVIVGKASFDKSLKTQKLPFYLWFIWPWTKCGLLSHRRLLKVLQYCSGAINTIWEDTINVNLKKKIAKLKIRMKNVSCWRQVFLRGLFGIYRHSVSHNAIDWWLVCDAIQSREVCSMLENWVTKPYNWLCVFNMPYPPLFMNKIFVRTNSVNTKFCLYTQFFYLIWRLRHHS